MQQGAKGNLLQSLVRAKSFGSFFFMTVTLLVLKPFSGQVFPSAESHCSENSSLVVNPFHVSVFFLYPLKTSENQRFSDVFIGYRKRPAA